MKKLKKKYIKQLLNYQFFLKNNSLKKNNLNFKNTLFENKFLFKNNDLNLNIIEINAHENVYLPSSLNSKLIYTIQKKFENNLLFNYNLDYNIIIFFNKLLFKNFLKTKKTIKGRIIGGNNKKIYLYILGFIFYLDPRKLNLLCNSKKKTFKFNKLKKKGYYSFIKIIKAKKIINCYKLRYLNFNIDLLNNFNKKLIFSRISYIEELIKKKKLNNIIINKKRSISKKLHVQKINKKRN
jgi:hypothetical protein